MVAVSRRLYFDLATRARREFPRQRIPLSSQLFDLLLTGGTTALASELKVSLRTLHRLLATQGTGALELRAWARREGIRILGASGATPRETAHALGFRSAATLQAFMRRELGLTGRELRAQVRIGALADKLTQ